VATRNEIIGFVHHVTGPAIGVPALQALFREVPTVLLEDLLTRYRRVWRRRYRNKGFRLTWHVGGAVWAMDFSEAPYLIDGVCMYLFAVRDLASHYQIAWIPVPDLRAETVLPLLEQLFEEHGAPLVLKSDNGSAFIAELLTEFLKANQVSQLFSPPRRPQYNGALERSNGVLKTYTGLHAIREGHAFRWTSDDLEHARQLANTISRPWGSNGPTPAETWQARERITAEQRGQFVGSVQEQLPRAAEDQGLPPVASLSGIPYRIATRLAIERTLTQSGYLTIKRPRRRKRRRKPGTTGEAKPPSKTLTAHNAPPPTASQPSALQPQLDDTEPSSLVAANVPACRNKSPRRARHVLGTSLQPQPKKNSASLLARSLERVTMPTGKDVPLVDRKEVRTRGSPPSERTVRTWLRRLNTLLDLAKKTAVSGGQRLDHFASHRPPVSSTDGAAATHSGPRRWVSPL